MEAKKFDEVEIGDKAFSANLVSDKNIKPVDLDYEGTILWKGNLDELLRSDYSDEAPGIYAEEDWEEAEDYDWVIIDSFTDGIILFNYNCDPCGVIALK